MVGKGGRSEDLGGGPRNGTGLLESAQAKGQDQTSLNPRGAQEDEADQEQECKRSEKNGA